METSDETLVQAAVAGDAGAFSALVTRHYDRIFRLAYRLTGHRAEAEDITQDICLALPKRLASFRGEARFTTWLYRLVVNVAQDRHRRATVRARTAQGWGEREAARRAEAEAARAAEDWLRSAMASLPDDLRVTLVLTMEDGMTHRAAADILGVSEGTVSWRLSEVRRRLRAQKEQDA